MLVAAEGCVVSAIYLNELWAILGCVLALHMEDPHSEPHAFDGCHAELAQFPLLVHGQDAWAVGPCNT